MFGMANATKAKLNRSDSIMINIGRSRGAKRWKFIGYILLLVK
jgi:hypothetical protein